MKIEDINIGDVIDYKSSFNTLICDNLTVLGKSTGSFPGAILVQEHCNEDRSRYFLMGQVFVDGWNRQIYISLTKDIKNVFNSYLTWISVDEVIMVHSSSVINKSQVTIPTTARSPGDSYIDGACCVICGNFSVYANNGFTCFSCTQDRYRSSSLNVDDPID